MGFEPLERGSGALYGACNGIWVMTLFAPPSREDMLLARPALQAMSSRCSQGFPTLTWILPSAGFSMDAEARKTAAKVTDSFTKEILSFANLIEGKGFQTAAVRAIISGLAFMERSAAPRKTFAELSAAVEWSKPFVRAPYATDFDIEATARAISAVRATVS